MPAPKATDDQIVQAYQDTPVVEALARRFDMSVRAMRYRIGNLRGKGLLTSSPDVRSPYFKPGVWECIEA